MDEPWNHIDDNLCRTFLSSVELVGKRWSSSVLLALARGAERFSDITAVVPGLSDRLLAQRLRELEHEQLIERRVIATTPVQVRYRLTDRGLDLMNSLQPLVGFGQRWSGSMDAPNRPAADRPTVPRTSPGVAAAS